MKRILYSLYFTALLAGALDAETFRTTVAGKVELSVDKAEGASAILSFVDALVVSLEGDKRFLRGIELDIRVPPAYLKYRGSLAAAFYAPLSAAPHAGVADLDAERVGFEVLPAKLQVVYHIPLRRNHGLKTTPYVTVATGTIAPSSFPLLFRITPVIKGLPEEMESLRFQVTAKPILADEGAVRVALKYPEKLKDKPLVLLVDDAVVAEPTKELVLSAGEHALTVLSDHYRNENRRFAVERGRVVELAVELQDPTPIMTLEAPENAAVFVNGVPVADPRKPFALEPGEHEIKFVIGDYAVVRPVSVLRGRNYRVSLSVDVTVTESD